ncbi:MAG: ABC transporter substrate-binding protein [Cumulibacter sp.]
MSKKSRRIASALPRRRTRRSFAPGLVALLMAGVLTACGSGSADDSAGDNTLKIANINDVPAFDPVVLGPTSATQMLSLVYEPLFTFDDQGELQPALATEYEFNDTGDQLIVTLRDGLTFQDGSALDAAAVAYHLNRGVSQENSAIKSSYRQIAKATAIDPTHVQIDLTETDFGFPMILANRSSLVASKEAAEADLDALNSTQPVGAGPFKVVKIVPGASMTLEKWDGYWDAENIYIDEVTVTLGADPATLISGLQTGEFNFVPSLSAQNAELAESSGLNVVADTAANWTETFVNVNKQLAPFTNPQVVEAFNAAIDRDAFVDLLTYGLGTASANPVPDSNPAYNPAIDDEYEYDPQKAKQLLAASGEDDLSLDVHIFPTANAPAELLQQQLEAVGFEVNLISEDVTAFYPGYYNKTDQVALYGYVGRDNKLLSLDEHFAETGILNLSGIEDPSYTAARQKVLQTPLDDPAYDANLQAAALAGVTTGGSIFLYVTPNVTVTGSEVSSFGKIDGSFRWNGITLG